MLSVWGKHCSRGYYGKSRGGGAKAPLEVAARGRGEIAEAPRTFRTREAPSMNRIVTANRLSDGVVVFQDANGAWIEDFNRAAFLSDEAALAVALKRAQQSAADNEVVEPYAVELASRAGHFAPKALREEIRASGPTVRRDLGKQAQGEAPTIVQRASREASHVPL